MSGWPCSVCDEVVLATHDSITVHTNGARHRLRMLGLSAEEAERIAQVCYEAGVDYEAAEAAIRAALSRPPGDYARMAADLRAVAAGDKT